MSPDASWTFSPGPILLVAFLLGAYLWRLREVRRRPDAARTAPGWRVALFLTGIVVLCAALFSPIDALGEQLFLMHMVQHVLLLDVVPVLLLLGLTKVFLRPITRATHSLERRAGWLAGPVFAIVVYVAAMWVWHIPPLYDAAVRHELVHVLEHVSFTFAGGLYWWHLLSPIRSRHALKGLGPVVYMAVTKVFVGILGVFLTFAPETIYEVYEEQPDYWGLSALSDQAGGGAIMAIEQALVMGIAIAFLFVKALNDSEREAQRRERLEDMRSDG